LASGVRNRPFCSESASDDRALGGVVVVDVNGVGRWWKPRSKTSTKTGLDQASKGATRLRRGVTGIVIEL